MALWAASGGSGGARALRPVLQRGSMARVAVMGARRPIVTWPTQPSQSSGAVLRTRLLQGRPSSSSSHPFQRSHWQQQQQPGGSRQEFSSSSGGGGSGAGRAQSRLWFLSMRAQAHPCKMYIHPHHTTPHHATSPGAREAQAADLAERNKRLGLYFFSIVVAVTGVCYASVPLYKVFCQVHVCCPGRGLDFEAVVICF